MNGFERVLNSYAETYTTQKVIRFTDRKNINLKFIGHYYRFENFHDVLSHEQHNKLLNWVSPDSEEQIDLVFYHEFDPKMCDDAFSLSISEERKVLVRTHNLRGLRYAYRLLEELVVSTLGQISCPVIEVNHPKPMSIRGIIEGFYGNPWNQQDRIDVIRYMGQHKMNTYMYAPKDDKYQRKAWRKLYPDKLMSEFLALQKECRREEIDFYYMISPGNDINLADPENINVLGRKLDQMIGLGFNHFGLLFDDIDYHLTGESLIKFTTAACAHANLANQINEFLKKQLNNYSLVVCPTEYDNAQGSPYLAELTQKLDPEIALFWTGPATLSSQISTHDLKIMAQVYQRPMIIWDNLPVNDFQKDAELVFLSAYKNRTPYIADSKYQVLGVVSNPMSEWEPSKITIGTMNDYLWNPNKYDMQQSFMKNIKELIPQGLVESFLTFSSFNNNHFTQKPFSLMQEIIIENSDVKAITDSLSNLVTAANNLQNGAKFCPLLKEIMPWLLRPQKDWNLWQAILRGDSDEIMILSAKLKKYPYRMGTDLVARYLEVHPIAK